MVGANGALFIPFPMTEKGLFARGGLEWRKKEEEEENFGGERDVYDNNNASFPAAPQIPAAWRPVVFPYYSAASALSQSAKD